MTPLTQTQAIKHTSPETLRDFRRRLKGGTIDAGDAAYDSARGIRSLLYDRRPAVIVRAADAGDVAETIQFARTHGLPMAVRSGGHSFAGFSASDGGVLLDLGGMKRIDLDPASATVRVQAGATSGDLAGPANEAGFALTTGDVSTVGLGGLTTGGGIGWMVRKYGLTIDHLISAQVVTADGKVLRVSETEHADLFWAIRGGGGNFGVVTEFEFRLDPVTEITGGMLVLPVTKEVLRAWADYAPHAPEELTTIPMIVKAPPAPFIPEHLVGQSVIFMFIVHTGSAEEADRDIAPLRALQPHVDLVARMPYPAIYDFTAVANAPARELLRSLFAEELTDEAIAAIVDGMDTVTSPLNAIQLRALGGAMARVPADATAFAHRDARFLVTVIGMWEDAADDGTDHRAWMERVFARVRHIETGVYANFLEHEPERLQQAYPADTYRRLVEVKRRYDPENFFNANQNIAPD